MRFEVSYASGTRHQVRLAKSLVVLGRDPGCDIVLNDTKCSRRHAVVEDRPEGLLVRDCGSANGIQVNGTRMATAVLRPGDTVRLGDVTLTLLPEVGETVVIAPSDLEPLTMPAGALFAPDLRPATASGPSAAKPVAVAPSFPPPPARAAASSAAASAPRRARPLTVGLLAVLWALSAPAAIAAVLYAAARLQAGPLGWAAAAAASLLLATLGATMVLGLRSLAPWARQLQMGVAAVGLLVCPFTLAWATVLLYLRRPEVKAAFDRRPGRGDAPPGSAAAEPAFALSILAMLVLGLGLCAVGALLARPLR